MIDYRKKGVFPELVRHFLATPEEERECRLWLQGDYINVSPELQMVLEEITTLPQKSIFGCLESFEVNDITVVQRGHFSYGDVHLPALQLTFQDTDPEAQGWWYSGFVDGLENITAFLEEIAKQKAAIPA